MSNDSLIENVSDTSFWVAYYRAKESERKDALFQDPFAKALVGTHGKNISDQMGKVSRYTEWSVVSRTVIIDRFIEKLVKEGVDTIVNLGAGLDARPYRMNLPANLEWIEVDYKNIIEHKSTILKGAEPKCKLTRVVVDLADDQDRKAFLDNVAPQAKNVLVITEGVIPYLTPEQVSALSKDIIANPRFKFWITEYFHPRVYPYLKSAVRTMKMKNAPFLFYPDDWFGFFRSLGWVEKETRYSGDIAVEFKRNPPMPFYAKIIMRFLPAHIKKQAREMSGYVIFQRAK